MDGDQPGNVLKKAAGGEARDFQELKQFKEVMRVPRLPIKKDRNIRKGDTKTWDSKSNNNTIKTRYYMDKRYLTIKTKIILQRYLVM